MKKRFWAAIPLVLFLLGVGMAQVTPPERYLNFRVGEDRKLADWSQITGYLRKLAKESDRIEIKEIGQSSEGRTMIMAVISAPENLRRQTAIREAMRKLADPRKLDEPEKQRILQSMPSVVLLNCSIHSTEIGASQFSMELAYRMASGNDEETLDILKNVVILLIPSPNPDGIDLVVDWYRKSIGKPHEGLAPPKLYQKYAGHDNNRDWYMLNLPETRAVTRVLYQQWFPQIVYDLHQMGRTSARMVIPPFYEVTNPLIDPLILRQIMLIGGHMATALSAAGVKGVATEAIYDMWWHGGFRTAPYFHNMVGLLTEAASARIASPDTVRKQDLRGGRRGLPDVKRFQTNFPEPWPGGVWRLRDIIDMEHITVRSVLVLAARHRRMWLENFYIMGQRALEKGRREAPSAFVVPLKQHDPASTRKMLDVLIAQGVEVQRAVRPFVADGHRFPAGTVVISTEQPFRANVLALLNPQFYPERRRYPGGPLENPYDMTGWTLSYQMGVDVIRIENRFQFSGEVLERAPEWPVQQEWDSEAAYYVLDSGSNDAYRAVNRLLDENVEVLWNAESILGDDGRIPPGRFLVAGNEAHRKKLRRAVQGLTVNVTALEAPPAFDALSLAKPRIGLYQGWVPNMDEGWTRYVLEDFGFDYETISDAEMRAGNLNERFDVIILPSMRDSLIINGFRYRPGKRTYPKSYCGGIGEVGVRHLQEFVENGGTLLCFGQACDLPIKTFWLKIQNVVAKQRQFSAPGSILRVLVNQQHPLAFGMPREANIFFRSNAVFRAMEGTPVLTYPLSNPLMSGWLQGDSLLYGQAAMTEVRQGDGRIVLYGFRPQHRAQTHGTYKLVFNGIYLSRAIKTRIGAVAATDE